jgi:hypothetical protein
LPCRWPLAGSGGKPPGALARLMLARGHMLRVSPLHGPAAALAALLLATACGGGDALPTGAPGPGGTTGGGPSVNPTPPPNDGPFLELDGEAVAGGYTLRVTRVDDDAGLAYRIELEADGWDVEVDVETWRVSGPLTEASLTSDSRVPEPDRALRIEKLVVRGAVLGTSGTAEGAFDRCRLFEEDAHRFFRQGLVFGRLTRLDTLAEGEFNVSGTDESCRRVEGAFAFRAAVE